MDSRARLIALIEKLYAAPGNDAGWRDFLVALCEATGGAAAHFLSHRIDDRTGDIFLEARIDPSALREYNLHYASRDPWAVGARMMPLSAGTVILGDKLIDHSQFKRTEYYADFARRHDLVRCLAGMVEVGPHGFAVIAVNGTEARGEFGSHEEGLLFALMPHIQRALHLHRRLEGAELFGAYAAAGFDQLSDGVFILGPQGLVIYANSSAREMVGPGKGLILNRGELRAADPRDTAALRLAIQRVLTLSAGERVEPADVVAVRRESSARPVLLALAPLGERSADIFPPAAAAVVVATDPDKSGLLSANSLQALLGITPGEARLARLLASGMDLPEAAQKLNLSVATVRTRLKSIFEKTGVHRQADLVRLILAATPRTRERSTPK